MLGVYTWWGFSIQEYLVTLGYKFVQMAKLAPLVGWNFRDANSFKNFFGFIILS